MSFWKAKANRIWRLFYKKVGSRQPKAGSDSTESNLGEFIESLSLVRRIGEDTHLQHAIQNGQTVLSQISLKISTRVNVCAILATLFKEIYDRNFDLESLKSAIEYGQEAVDLTPAGNPDRAGYLHNLNNHLSARYEREGRPEDLIQAIKYSQEAVDLTPTGNPDRTRYLNNLSIHLSTRYRKEGKLEDLT